MISETRSTGLTLTVVLENFFQQKEMASVQGLIDAVSKSERTLGVIAYVQKKNLFFRTSSLGTDIGPSLSLIKRSIREDRNLEEFGWVEKTSVFSYCFPIKDRQGRLLGAVAILQDTSMVENEISKAEWSIFITLFVLIAGTMALVLIGTRKWVILPISKLIEGAKKLAEGNLDHQITFKTKDELSELAEAFNQMAVDLKKAQQRIIQEADVKLELERSLRQSEKLATIGQLASGLAHEVGTPLNIIYGRTEMIKRRLEDGSDIKKNLDIILGQTERITKIIQQLLDLVRKRRSEQSPVSIRSLVETTLDLLDQQIQKQGIRVVEDFKEDTASVRGDADQLQQVFLNLILNALQAMPEGGTLRISTASKRIAKEGLGDVQEPYFEIIIEDTGVGMEKEAIQNIFKPFFTTKDSGTGLGLMVTQGIIQDHEGWITVDSEVGKGSVFKVYLPLPREERSID
jgi:signal transduction histidine kinase